MGPSPKRSGRGGSSNASFKDLASTSSLAHAKDHPNRGGKNTNSKPGALIASTGSKVPKVPKAKA